MFSSVMPMPLSEMHIFTCFVGLNLFLWSLLFRLKDTNFCNFVTYKIEDDIGDKLKKTVRTACNFWNRFVSPKFSIVIRLGLFSQNSNTIARAYKPYEKDNVKYGKVEFNTKFLNQYPDNAIIGTITSDILAILFTPPKIVTPNTAVKTNPLIQVGRLNEASNEVEIIND